MNVDVTLLRLFNDHRGRTLDAIAPHVNTWGYYALPAAAVVCALIRRNRASAMRASDVVLAWFVAGFVVDDVLKAFVHRPRPSAVPALRGVIHVLGRVPPPHAWSFPSSTAAAVFAASTSLWFAYGRRVGLAATAVASVVCLTRVYAGVHYPSDLVAGAVFGVLVAWLGFRLSAWLGRSQT